MSIFEYLISVQESDIDIVGHVNNVVYVQWMQDAAMAHSASLGWPVERYQVLGAGWVARLHQIEYLQPAYPGDLVILKTWVSEMRKVTSLRKYQFVRYDNLPDKPHAEIVLANAHTNWAFIDFQSRTPKRIPVEIASAYPIIANLSAST